MGKIECNYDVTTSITKKKKVNGILFNELGVPSKDTFGRTATAITVGTDYNYMRVCYGEWRQDTLTRNKKRKIERVGGCNEKITKEVTYTIYYSKSLIIQVILSIQSILLHISIVHKRRNHKKNSIIYKEFNLNYISLYIDP